jgi:hypothetical protein
MRTYRQKSIGHKEYAEDLSSNFTRWLEKKSRRLPPAMAAGRMSFRRPIQPKREYCTIKLYIGQKDTSRRKTLAKATWKRYYYQRMEWEVDF